MSSHRKEFCLNYSSDYETEWKSSIPKITECDEFLTFPIIILSYFVIVSIPYVFSLVLKSKVRRKWSALFILKNICFALLLAVQSLQIYIDLQGPNMKLLNILYPSVIIFAILIQLTIVHVETVRDVPKSGAFFLGSFLIFLTALAKTWSKIALNLRMDSPSSVNVDALWPLSTVIGLDELAIYVFCALSFISLLLSAWSDRRPPYLVQHRKFYFSDGEKRAADSNSSGLTQSHRSGGDRVGLHTDLQESPLVNSISSPYLKESEKDVTGPLCPEKYASFPSRMTFFWFTKLVIKGFRSTLTMADIWRLDLTLTAVHLCSRFLPRINRHMQLTLSQEMDESMAPKPFWCTENNSLSLDVRCQDRAQSMCVSGSRILPSSLSSLNSAADHARSPSARRNTCAEVSGLQTIGGSGSHRLSRSRTSSYHQEKDLLPPLMAGTKLKIGQYREQLNVPSTRQNKIENANDLILRADSPPDKDGSNVSNKLDDKPKIETEKLNTGLMVALLATFWPSLLIAAFYKLVHDLCLFGGPILLKLLLGYLAKDSVEPVWHGYLFAVLMLTVAMLQSFVLQQYFLLQMCVGMDMRTVLISVVYRKSLVLSPAARHDWTAGEITNLMSTDAQRFFFLMQYINMIWSAPLQIAIALYLLWNELGPSVLAGLAVLIIMIPINAYIARITKTLQEKQLKQSDCRIKMISELLNGIQVLKLYAWEPSFMKAIGAIRGKELGYLRKFAFLDCAISFVFSCAPMLVALLTFATFVISSSENVLNAEKAFVSLSLFNILRFPLFMFPTLLSNLVQTYVSVQRLTKFLLSPELNQKTVGHDETPGVSAVIEHGTFSWSLDVEPTLHNVTIYFTEGQSIAIVGRVGSGKSSLLNALLGNMEKISGRVNMKGSVALVSQQAWIFNATLRENILFHHPYDPLRYESIVKACALEPDISTLPEGDETEIGDKGVNLSGGQKQRISIARACYANKDVYLLDDPLAAVDTHVATHLLFKVFGRRGILSDKTRIIATHNPHAIQAVDRIAIIENGRIVEYGTFSKLTQHRNSRLNVFLTSSETLEADQAVDEVGTSLLSRKTSVISVERNRSRMTSESQLSGVLQLCSVPANQADLNFVKTHHQSHNEPLSLSETETLSVSQRGNDANPENSVTVSRKEPQNKSPLETADGKASNKDETSATGKVKMAVFWMYVRHMGSLFCLFGFTSMVGYQLVSVGMSLWLAAWSGDSASNHNLTALLDQLAANNQTDSPEYLAGVSTLNSERDHRLGIYGLFGVVQVIFNLAAYLLLAAGNVRAVATVHKRLLNCILQVPTAFFNIVPQGRIMNRFSSDVSSMDNQLITSLRSMLNTLLQCIVTLVLAASLSPWILIPLFFLSVFYICMQKVFVKTSRQLKRIESVGKSPIFSHFSETLLGMETIRAYDYCAWFVRTNDERLDNNNASFYATIIANRWLSIILETVGNILTFLVAFTSVAAKGYLTAGFVGLVVTYALNITQTLNWLVRMSAELESNVVCVERIKEYSELEPEAPWEVEEEKPPIEWPMGGLQFVNYSTRYRPELDLVLRSISCVIKPGEKIGIVGRTGSGKSSMVLGLFRILEASEGQILIDGRDIAKLGLHDLRSRLTLIPQDPVLFSGSLRFNLDPFQAYTDEVVWKALEMADLKSYVEEMSGDEGLLMKVAEGGANLSQGQRQQVCLARALLRRSRILVLDEATAAVDPQTDLLIQTTIRREFIDSTVITIAHRVNTIMDYDRIMVLDDGRLIEIGTPEDLLSNADSVFHGLVEDSNR